MKTNTYVIRENKVTSEDNWLLPTTTQDFKFYDLDMKEHKKILMYPNT